MRLKKLVFRKQRLWIDNENDLTVAFYGGTAQAGQEVQG
jgi:hypothetical protein